MVRLARSVSVGFSVRSTAGIMEGEAQRVLEAEGSSKGEEVSQQIRMEAPGGLWM